MSQFIDIPEGESAEESQWYCRLADWKSVQYCMAFMYVTDDDYGAFFHKWHTYGEKMSKRFRHRRAWHYFVCHSKTMTMLTHYVLNAIHMGDHPWGTVFLNRRFSPPRARGVTPARYARAARALRARRAMSKDGCLPGNRISTLVLPKYY